MAIAYVNSADLGSNIGTTFSAAYTVTAGSSMLRICFTGDAGGGNDDVTSVKYGTATATLDAKVVNGVDTNSYMLYQYVVFSPPNGSNNVVITTTNSHHIGCLVAEYSGTVTSGSPDSAAATNAGEANVTAVTAEIWTTHNNCWVFGCSQYYAAGVDATAGAGATLRVANSGIAIFDSNSTVSSAGSNYSMTANIAGGGATEDFLLLLVSYPQADSGAQPAGIFKRQGAINSNNGNAGTSIALAFPASVGSGNAVAVGFKMPNTTDTPSITDDQSNTYPAIVSANRSDNARKLYAAFLANITNGPIVITATWTTSGTNQAMAMTEFVGIASGSADASHANDQTNISTGTDAVTSGSMTTNYSGDLIWCATISGIGGITSTAVGTGFSGSNLPNWGSDSNPIGDEYRIQVSAGPVAGTWTPNASGEDFTTVALALRSATACPHTLATMGVGCSMFDIGASLRLGAAFWAARKLQDNKTVTRRRLILPRAAR